MIVIIDYGVGNVGSVLNMLRKVGARARISADKAEIEAADKLILPGVGHFGRGMGKLNETGLVPTLNEQVMERGKAGERTGGAGHRGAGEAGAFVDDQSPDGAADDSRIEGRPAVERMPCRPPRGAVHAPARAPQRRGNDGR